MTLDDFQSAHRVCVQLNHHQTQPKVAGGVARTEDKPVQTFLTYSSRISMDQSTHKYT
jgi:hypothetical protein